MSFLKRFGSNKQHNAYDPSSIGSKPSNLKRALSPFSSRPTSQSQTISRSNMPAVMATAEPPPAYEPLTATAPIHNAVDDQYAFLRTFDTIFLIDDSSSMAGRSWHETAAALAAITPICTTHDADGIDIYFLNQPDSVEYRNITCAADVSRIFKSVRPSGYTPTGQRLSDILKPYLSGIERKGVVGIKPLNLIVITDGVPSDDVESVIKMAMKKLEVADAPSWQVGIQFFQVGNESGAAEALKELDDNVPHDGCQRDIVDTVPWSADKGGLSAEGILKVVLGAVNKKLDRKSNTLDHTLALTGRSGQMTVS